MRNIIIVLFAISLLPLANCKKEKGNDPPAPTEPARFWVVNLDDTEDYKIFGSILPDTILLKSGEKTIVYTCDSIGKHMLLRLKQSEVDTSYLILPVHKSYEYVYILIRNWGSVFLKSPCFLPPPQKSLVRFIDFTGHNRMDAISGTDTTFIKTPTPDINHIPTDACNFINPGTYSMQAYDTSNAIQPAVIQNIFFAPNKVYFVFVGYDGKISSIER